MGRPPAIFETDEESHYFLTVLPIHPEAGKRATSASQNTPVYRCVSKGFK